MSCVQFAGIEVCNSCLLISFRRPCLVAASNRSTAREVHNPLDALDALHNMHCKRGALCMYCSRAAAYAGNCAHNR
jgi:hypothetical protein